MGCVSSGKIDIIDISEETGYSQSMIRNFLNQLSDQGLVDKTFVPEMRAPVCYIPSKGSHNEYTINNEGKRYLMQQLEVWKEHPSYIEEIAMNIVLK